MCRYIIAELKISNLENQRIQSHSFHEVYYLLTLFVSPQYNEVILLHILKPK